MVRFFEILGLMANMFGVAIVGLWQTQNWWKVVYLNALYIKYNLNFWGWALVFIGFGLQLIAKYKA